MRSVVLALLLIVALLLPNAVGQSPGAEAAFGTPEEAITHYLDGVARNDVDQILQACATHEMAEGFAFALQVEMLGGMMILGEFLSPAETPFYAELNRMKVSARILNQVNLLTLSLLSSEEISPVPIPGVDSERVARFVRELDPMRLAGLEIVSIGRPDEALMDSPRYLEHAARFAGIYGADEQTERVVLLSFEERLFVIGFTLLRYGESWKIGSQSSPLGRTEADGTARESTLEEFEDLIAGNQR